MGVGCWVLGVGCWVRLADVRLVARQGCGSGRGRAAPGSPRDGVQDSRQCRGLRGSTFEDDRRRRDVHREALCAVTAGLATAGELGARREVGLAPGRGLRTVGARQHKLYLGSAPPFTAARFIHEAEHHEGVGSRAAATANRAAAPHRGASPGTDGKLLEEPRYIGGRQQHRWLFVDRHGSSSSSSSSSGGGGGSSSRSCCARRPRRKLGWTSQGCPADASADGTNLASREPSRVGGNTATEPRFSVR